MESTHNSVHGEKEMQAQLSAGSNSLLRIATALIVSVSRRSKSWLGQNFEEEGLSVQSAESLDEALSLIRHGYFQVIVLDDDFLDFTPGEFCSQLAKEGHKAKVPVLVLSSMADEGDVCAALDGGADDYLTKPYSFEVLLARVTRLLRTYADRLFEHRKDAGLSSLPDRDELIRVGPITILPRHHDVFVRGQLVKLTFTEFRLLVLLASDVGKAFDRKVIFQDIYGDDHEVSDRAIDSQVFLLRKKLAPYEHAVETVRSVGYRLINPTAF